MGSQLQAKARTINVDVCTFIDTTTCTSPQSKIQYKQVSIRNSTPHAVCMQVSDAERAMVKQLMYGLAYGMGSGRIAATLGVSELKAREMSDDFKGSHPALIAWMQVRVKDCPTGSLSHCAWCCSRPQRMYGLEASRCDVLCCAAGTTLSDGEELVSAQLAPSDGRSHTV